MSFSNIALQRRCRHRIDGLDSGEDAPRLTPDAEPARLRAAFRCLQSRGRTECLARRWSEDAALAMWANRPTSLAVARSPSGGGAAQTMPIGRSMTTSASFRAAWENSGPRSRVSSKTGEDRPLSRARTQCPSRAPSIPISFIQTRRMLLDLMGVVRASVPCRTQPRSAWRRRCPQADAMRQLLA